MTSLRSGFYTFVFSQADTSEKLIRNFSSEVLLQYAELKLEM